MPDAPKSVPNGLLVIFEGIDGVGKTTQLGLAQKALQEEGWPVHTSRNLGGTPIGEALREVIKSPLPRPNTTNLYISVAIQEALIETMQAERAKNQIILMDRGPISLAAYEVYGEDLEESLGWHYVDRGMERLKPDLTILYEANVDTAISQARQKSGEADYFESKPREFFERVAKGYAAAAKRYQTTVATVDANQSIEVVHEQTMRLIQQALAATHA
ncbi:MAG TPA: dTMP kinase [Candidatus Saccharimonadales bacterium]